MKILIAEDEEFLRLILNDFLSELGHEVKCAGNGVELITMAMGERPDLVITDLNMPEMAGDSMIAMLDMYPGLAGVPVIVITGETASAIKGRGIPKEIPILPKPFDFGQIAREIFRFEGAAGKG